MYIDLLFFLITNYYIVWINYIYNHLDSPYFVTTKMLRQITFPCNFSCLYVKIKILYRLGVVALKYVDIFYFDPLLPFNSPYILSQFTFLPVAYENSCFPKLNYTRDQTFSFSKCDIWINVESYSFAYL